MTRPVRWLRLLGMVAVIAGALTSAAPGPALATGGGAALTPIMGWSSWSNFRGGITERIVVAQAQAMHRTLQSHGYTYINIDSGWTNREDGFGRRLWNTTRFPSGIPALASQLHGMGLKLGIYLTPGISRADVAANVPVFGTSFHAQDFADTTANGNTTGTSFARIDLTKPGSHEYIQSLANLYASWGIDYIKMDFVGPGGGRVPADKPGRDPGVAPGHPQHPAADRPRAVELAQLREREHLAAVRQRLAHRRRHRVLQVRGQAQPLSADELGQGVPPVDGPAQVDAVRRSRRLQRPRFPGGGGRSQ
jgi:alpha-galactosidase